MKFRLLFGSAVLAAMCNVGTVNAANLVQNGDFETGDFTDWTTGSANYVTTDYAHTGSYGVKFGAVGFNSPLSQVLATTTGATYDISFWLHSNNEFPNAVTLSFGGDQLFNQTDITTNGWQKYTFTATATSTTTDLAFGLRQDPAYSGLDDISVTTGVSSVPLPASAPMFGAALVVLGVAGYGLKQKKITAAL